MASSLTGSLAENLLYRRCSFIDNPFFVRIYDKFLINDEYFRLLPENILPNQLLIIIYFLIKQLYQLKDETICDSL